MSDPARQLPNGLHFLGLEQGSFCLGKSLFLSLSGGYITPISINEIAISRTTK